MDIFLAVNMGGKSEMGGFTIKNAGKKTLKEIGDALDLSKERVRQLELIALQKLRHVLSIEEFELLTG